MDEGCIHTTITANIRFVKDPPISDTKSTYTEELLFWNSGNLFVSCLSFLPEFFAWAVVAILSACVTSSDSLSTEAYL